MKDFMRKKETLGLLDISFHVKENVVKISRHEKFEHALAKFCLSWELMQSGQDIVTEAIFQNNKRADILALQEGTAYEILCSEKPENILKKEKEYPVAIKPFKAQKVIEQSLHAFLKKRK
jgi:hypothetical protein